MNKPPSVKETNQLQDDPLSLWPDLQSRPQDGLFRISRWMPWRSGGWTWTRMMVRLLLHGCGQEIYSLLYRIRFQYRSASLCGGVGVGPLVEPDCNGVLRPCKRSLACIRDMQSFVAAYPWATDFDRTLFRDAWLEGARFADRSADSDTGESTSQPFGASENSSIADSTDGGAEL